MESWKANFPTQLLAIGFDGKKTEVSSHMGPSAKKELISTVAYPGEVFLGSYEPHDGSGMEIANVLFQLAVTSNSLETLKVNSLI